MSSELEQDSRIHIKKKLHLFQFMLLFKQESATTAAAVVEFNSCCSNCMLSLVVYSWSINYPLSTLR